MEDKKPNFLTSLFNKRGSVKPSPQPGPKTRPETDEEFLYRAAHTPFYCPTCGNLVYPEWRPTKYSTSDGTPTHFIQVQACGRCGEVFVSTMSHQSPKWDNYYNDTWYRLGMRDIYRKNVPDE